MVFTYFCDIRENGKQNHYETKWKWSWSWFVRNSRNVLYHGQFIAALWLDQENIDGLTAVTPLQMHWNDYSLALYHRHVPFALHAALIVISSFIGFFCRTANRDWCTFHIERAWMIRYATDLSIHLTSIMKTEELHSSTGVRQMWLIVIFQGYPVASGSRT